MLLPAAASEVASGSQAYGSEQAPLTPSSTPAATATRTVTATSTSLPKVGHAAFACSAPAIDGDLRPQSEDFSLTNLPLQLRPRTVANVPWTLTTMVDEPIASPDFAPVIEEIVAQAGWQAGNNLAIFLDYQQATTEYVDWQAYDHNPAAAARLIVSYQWAGEATPTATPTVSPTPTNTPAATATPTATPLRRHLPLILRS